MKSIDTIRERCKALAQWMEQIATSIPSPTHKGGGAGGPWPGRSQRWPALGLALVLPLSAQAKTFRCSAGDVACLIDAINEANANGESEYHQVGRRGPIR